MFTVLSPLGIYWFEIVVKSQKAASEIIAPKFLKHKKDNFRV